MSKVQKAIASGDLEIGDITIPCAVLKDGTRVVNQQSVDNILGRSKPSVKPNFGKLPSFLRPKNIQPFISPALMSVAQNPIKYTPLRGGQAIGLKAELLPEVCAAWVEAEKNRALLSSQKHIAEQAYILLKAFANVGIIALVDEATGYQEIRTKKALAEILEKYLEKEYHKWTRTFPLEFYEEIFRLKGWDFTILAEGKHPPMPSYIGRITKQIVYERLPPGIIEELERLNPKIKKGHRLSKHHQWFNPQYGYPKLKEHIASVIALMRASSRWIDFTRGLKRAFPHPGEQTEMDV